MEEDVIDKEFRLEAIRVASDLHRSPVANSVSEDRNPTDVIVTAQRIYEWLKGSR